MIYWPARDIARPLGAHAKDVAEQPRFELRTGQCLEIGGAATSCVAASAKTAAQGLVRFGCRAAQVPAL
jgi:hypothetical protein